MRFRRKVFAQAILAAAIGLAAVLLLGSCAAKARSSRKTIVVSYSILGSVVKDLVGDAFDVVVSIPDGLDPHEWEPSAKDIEAIDSAALVVENGLGLEEGMKKALAQAREAGVHFFTASDHVVVRRVGKGEGVSANDGDQTIGARDPHLWTDPLAVKAAADSLADAIKADFGVDLGARREDLDARLIALDQEISGMVAKLPLERRALVTGHESLGYFASRYGFRLVGAVLPSLSSQAESSAADLALLKKLIALNGVPAVFIESGSNSKVAQALAKDAGAVAVPLAMHSLPKGGGYAEYLRGLASAITGALKP
jgi:zinc/manganese transport system substrate-binding protein